MINWHTAQLQHFYPVFWPLTWFTFRIRSIKISITVCHCWVLLLLLPFNQNQQNDFAFSSHRCSPTCTSPSHFWGRKQLPHLLFLYTMTLQKIFYIWSPQESSMVAYHCLYTLPEVNHCPLSFSCLTTSFFLDYYDLLVNQRSLCGLRLLGTISRNFNFFSKSTSS